MTEDENQQHAADVNILWALLFRAQAHRGNVTTAIIHLLNRIRWSIESLVLLSTHNPDHSEMDCASIVRTVYDAHIQVLYILQEPDVRADLFLDFYWVDLKRFNDLVPTLDLDAFKLLAERPKRAQFERETVEALEEVKHRFLDRAGRLRSKWYAGSLADLSRAVECEAEYRALMLSLNAVVHSSAFGLNQPSGVNSASLCHIAWTVLFRALGRTAEYMKVALPEEVAAVVAYSYEPIFNIDEEALERLRKEFK